MWIANFVKFRRNIVSRIFANPQNPPNFLPAKISSLKIKAEINTFLLVSDIDGEKYLELKNPSSVIFNFPPLHEHIFIFIFKIK